MSEKTTHILESPGTASAARGWLELFRFFIVRAAWTRRALLACFVLAVPALIGIVVRAAGTIPPDRMALYYWASTVFMMYATAVPLTAMMFGTTIISAEVAAGTSVYLFTRSMGRVGVLLAKFLAVGIVLAAGACAGQALLFAVAAMGQGGMPLLAGVPELWGGLAAACLGALAFCSLFLALGTFLARPFGAAVGYLILCEWIFANVPLDIRRFSVNHYLRAIVSGAVETSPAVAGLREIVTGGVSAGFGAFTLLCVIALAVGATAMLVTWREFTRAREEQK
jgi:ABC-2 type transport system permease protein